MTFNCHSIVNKFTFCMNSVLIFWWTDEQMFLPMWIDEIGKNQDKSINEKSVPSISSDWSIQSISIKSDLLTFINSSIDKSILIFINWLLQDIHEWATVTINATILHTISGECIEFVSQPFDQVAYPQNSISGDHMSLVDEKIFALQDKGLFSPVPMNLVNSFHPFLPVWHCETYP